MELDQNMKVVKHILKYLHAKFSDENTSFDWANQHLKSVENKLLCQIEIKNSFGQFPSISTLHISPIHQLTSHNNNPFP